MNVSMIISMLVAALVFLIGVYALITGKIIVNTEKQKEAYTASSLSAFHRVAGIIFMAVGVILVVFYKLPDKTDMLRFLLITAGVVLAIVLLICGKFMLKKTNYEIAKESKEEFIEEN